MIPNRIVLDTNVCLDLFIFRDPRWEDLHLALRENRLQAVTRADCRNEWLHVLSYSHLRLDSSRREQASAEFDALITRMDAPPRTQALPLCKDTDDQKFLELARDSHASALITKDKALLKLARKTARAGLFLIAPPVSWTLCLAIGAQT